MKLHTLAVGILVMALISLPALGVFGYQAWRAMVQGEALLTRIDTHTEHAVRMGTGIEEMTFLRADADALKSLGEEADALRQSLQDTAGPAAAVAARHLQEVARITGTLAAALGADANPARTLGGIDPFLASQLRIHHAGLRAALDDLHSDAHREVVDALRPALGAFAVATAAFALLVVFAGAVILRRVGAPLLGIEAAIRRVAAGDLGARVAATRNDELGELARWFNRMAAQREAQESRLQDSELRFRQLAENIDDVFWLTTPDKSRMLYISPAYERIWGLAREDLYRDPGQWLAPIHPADRERVRSAAQAQALGTYDQEYRIVRADGTVRWISDRAFPVHDAGGRVYRIAGVAKDITDHRQAQIALRERVKELQCLYRVLELTTSDTIGTDLACAEVARMLPRSLLHAAEGVARVVVDRREFLSERWQPPASKLHAPVTVAGEIRGFVEAGYPEGVPEALPGSSSPFLHEEQTLVEGVAAHIGHMFDSRRMADNLAQSERLNAVGQLTGGVAHDFNNLLTVIVGNAQVLADELAGRSDLRGMAQMIGEAGQRGAELTRRLLAFARRQALAPAAVDVNGLLEHMGPLLRRTLGEHVEIRTAFGNGLWPALVDPHQLESAVLNLCINARDAMPGGGKLTLETSNTDLDGRDPAMLDHPTPGDYVMIAVTDTGTGIVPEHLERVFEPFFSTKDVGEGTGLGLSMVYGFVKQSGGHVRLYSEPGQGTSVRLYLPRHTGDGEAMSTNSGEPQIVGGNESILLVEDDDLVRRYASTQLTALGYRVIQAGSGPQAMVALRGGEHIDLLFTDVVMPGGMSGRDLAESARGLRPGLRVLYTSGYTESAIVHHGRLDPGVQLLGKPYRRAELARRIRAVLDGAPDE